MYPDKLSIEILKFAYDLDTLLSHEATGEDLWMALKHWWYWQVKR